MRKLSILSAALITACSSEPAENHRAAETCVPGESQQCDGQNRCAGVQACDDDGTYGACECSGDYSAPPDEPQDDNGPDEDPTGDPDPVCQKHYGCTTYDHFYPDADQRDKDSLSVTYSTCATQTSLGEEIIEVCATNELCGYASPGDSESPTTCADCGERARTKYYEVADGEVVKDAVGCRVRTWGLTQVACRADEQEIFLGHYGHASSVYGVTLSPNGELTFISFRAPYSTSSKYWSAGSGFGPEGEFEFDVQPIDLNLEPGGRIELTFRIGGEGTDNYGNVHSGMNEVHAVAYCPTY